MSKFSAVFFFEFRIVNLMTNSSNRFQREFSRENEKNPFWKKVTSSNAIGQFSKNQKNCEERPI